MSKFFTQQELKHMAETAPEKLQQELELVQSKQSSWRERARKVLAFRQQPGPTSRFDAMAYNYNLKFIKTGSVLPLVHMMFLLGTVGYGFEYYSHHRHTPKEGSKDH